MRATLAAILLAFAGVALPAQAPAPASDAPGTRALSSPLGFSYALPAGWQVRDSLPPPPDIKEKTSLSGTGQSDKKGVACTHLDLTARRDDPRSVIDQVVLPLACASRPYTQSDLPDLGAGAAQGIKQNFEIGAPQTATYSLGSHQLWAERVEGTVKGQSEKHYTIEMSCTLLSKAAVCWLALAADGAALADFERSTVTLENDSPAALVPAGTFKQ